MAAGALPSELARASVIKVTDRRDATVIAYDAAEDSIRRELRSEKLGPVRTDYVLVLREKAEIVYPEEG